MICRGKNLPLVAEDATTIICLLFSTPKTCTSFDPFFSHVFSPFEDIR
jgi:hypothetical protein